MIFTPFLVSNNVAPDVPPEDKYRYCDDLHFLELLLLSGLLVEYEHLLHVPSDVSPEQLFLPPEILRAVDTLDSISEWTEQNKMLLNPLKSSFTLFSKSKQNFTTRLKIDGKTIERKK